MTLLQAYQITKIALSFKVELLVIGFSMMALLLLPFFTVITLTNTASAQISEDLVEADPATGQVLLKSLDGATKILFNKTVQWPVRGPITAGFGDTNHPYTGIHNGLDIAGTPGTPIAAIADGTILYAASINWGYGKHIAIDHGYNIVSVYGHLASFAVKTGNVVKRGQIIGTMGNTGWSTGPHLHLQINSHGIPVDPLVFLP